MIPYIEGPSRKQRALITVRLPENFKHRNINFVLKREIHESIQVKVKRKVKTDRPPNKTETQIFCRPKQKISSSKTSPTSQQQWIYF